MREEALESRDELISFIEQDLGWDVTMTRTDQDDRYEDEPIELELEIRCRKRIKRSNDFQIK